MASKGFFKRFIFAFLSGVIAVFVFHQGVLSVLYAVGFTARAPFPMQPTKPFGLPVIWSLAFWGGVWGLIFAAVDRGFPRGVRYWIWTLVFGALAPTLVAWFLVAALKGQPLGGGWKGSAMITGLLVNGAWGLGTALFLRAFCRSAK
jgi:hypothetical protein